MGSAMKKGAKTMRKRSNFEYPVVFSDSQPSYIRENSPQSLMVYDVTYLHYHRYLELGVCLEGEGVCVVEGEEYPFSQGDVQIIFAFQRHLSKNTCSTPSRWYWAVIDPMEALEQAGFAAQDKVRSWLLHEMGICGIVDRTQYPEICKTVQEIIARIYHAKDYPCHRMESLGCQLLMLITQLCHVSRELPKLPLSGGAPALEINPALESINDSLAMGRMPKVEALFPLCGMSEVNFRRVFRKHMGVSPKEYITACCIHKAKRLLACTDLPVTEVAAQVGYENISGFNRCFLAAVGVSPREFRRQILGDTGISVAIPD